MRGLSFNYVIGQEDGRVELYIDRGAEDVEASKRISTDSSARRRKSSGPSGASCPGSARRQRSCRIAHTVNVGGWRSDESVWPEVQDAMIDGMVRLERALKPQIAGLKSEFA